MAIPALHNSWRTSNPDDRDVVRQWAQAPVTESGMTWITSAMNTVASLLPGTVVSCKAWIDEALELEEAHAAQVAAGTAHLGNATVYEGLRPGADPTRDDLRSKADVLEWDVETLYKVRIESGNNPTATAQGQTAQRIAVLQQRVLTALGLSQAASGGAQLFRG